MPKKLYPLIPKRIILLLKSDVKCGGSTSELHLKLTILSGVEASGIPGVAVKCVDIRRNTGGEGGFLDRN